MSRAKTKAKDKTPTEELEAQPPQIKVFVGPDPKNAFNPVGGLHPRPFHKPIQSGSFRPFGGRR